LAAHRKAVKRGSVMPILPIRAAPTCTRTPPTSGVKSTTRRSSSGWKRNSTVWVLHTSATPAAIGLIAPLLPEGARWRAWVKGFAAFKRNVVPTYAWEPVVVRAARKPLHRGFFTRDWVECRIAMERGLTGAKPEAVCHWAL